MVIAPAFMASNVIVGRFADGVVPPFGLAFWRWALAVLVLLPFTVKIMIQHLPELRKNWWKILILGGFGMGISGATPYIGLRLTTAINAGLLFSVSPVMIMLLSAVMFAETIKRRQLIGVVLAIAGVIVIVSGGDLTRILTFSFNQGDFWLIGSVTSWAIYSVLLKKFHLPIPGVLMLQITAMAGLIWLLPFYIFETWNGQTVALNTDTLLAITVAALVAGLLAYLTYAWCLRIIGPAQAGLFMYLIPLYSAGLAVLLLGATIENFHLIGGALVLPGVAIATLPDKIVNRITGRSRKT